MTPVIERAEEVRKESLARILANARLRDKTRANLLKIDDACRRLVERRAELSVVSVLQMISDLHPDTRLAVQTFYNKTPSGACYRELIAIWRTYERAVNQLKRTRATVNVEDDLPDVLLNQLKPEGARVIVLAMRTSLRNLRRQMVMLRSITPDKLVRHHAAASNPAADVTPALVLTSEEMAILNAFVDPVEISSRGAEWDDIGRLTFDGEPLSRAGLLQVIDKIRDACGPPTPEANSKKTKNR